MQIRRFGPELKTKSPGNHPGLYGVLIQKNRAQMPQDKQEELVKRWGGMPLLLNANLQIEAMYFEPHASMEEHSADHPILFLAILGQGHIRIGGPMGETHEIRAGEAVLWPAHTDHAVWTGDEPLHAIVINTQEEMA